MTVDGDVAAEGSSLFKTRVQRRDDSSYLALGGMGLAILLSGGALMAGGATRFGNGRGDGGGAGLLFLGAILGTVGLVQSLATGLSYAGQRDPSVQVELQFADGRQVSKALGAWHRRLIVEAGPRGEVVARPAEAR